VETCKRRKKLSTNYKSIILAVSLFLALSVSISTAPGDLNLTFGSGGTVIGEFNGDIAIQPDGKIVLVGNGSNTETNNVDYGAARYNPNGSLDTSF
jgi:hypothetical protein